MALQRRLMRFQTGFFVQNPDMAYVRRIHQVSREGTIQRPVNSAPAASTREFQYIPSLGRFLFGTQAISVPFQYELIEIIYEA